MEEMWNMRASSIKSSAQLGPSTTNQGHHPDKLRSELVGMVSGSQQHVTSPSYASSLSGRSPYAASLSQFSHMNLPDLGACSGWPSQSASILSQMNCGNGGSKSSSWAGAPLGQDRHFSSALNGGRTQDSLQAVNGSLEPAVNLLTRGSLSFGRRAGEPGMEGHWHLPSSQWSKEPPRQWLERKQCSSTPFSTSGGDRNKEGVLGPLNSTGSGFLSVCQSTSSGRFRVYCISFFGVPVVGQLGLSDAGRLGVTCSCHGHHLSVAKFSQHCGLHAANPGEVVYMEGGDTLVQWRKSFFSQYGVKVPEDSVGWEWLDGRPPMEAGHGIGKCQAAVPMTRSWQKEVDVPCGRITPMLKSRTTTHQMWDASLSNWNASTLLATESISNTKCGLLSIPGNDGVMLDSRDSVLKSYGQHYKNLASDLESRNHFYSTSSVHESHHSRASSTFQSMGHEAMNGHDGHSNCGGPRYNPFARQQQQVIGGSRKGSRLSETGQEFRMGGFDISSRFELQLGQPSQQTQAAGTSLPSMATSSVEHPKSHLFEKVMRKVWDGKLQHNLQQLNPTNLPKSSGIKEGLHQSRHEKSSENLENDVLENCGGEIESADFPTASSQSPKQLTHNASQAGYRADRVTELQEKLMSLELLQSQSGISNRSGDHHCETEPPGSEKLAAKFFPQTPVDPSPRVVLENGTTLESLSSRALEQLSKKTGQRLLETAIQSSFTYRAMGLEGPTVGSLHLSGVVPSSSRAEGQLFGQLDAFGRSNFVGGHRPSFLEILVSNQLRQNESELRCGLAVASADWSNFRVEQDSNLHAFQTREHPGMTFTNQQLHLMQRLVDLGRLSDAQQKSERQSSMTNRNGREEQQGTVMDRQRRGRKQGGPETAGLAKPGLESSKVQNDAMIPRRLTQPRGEGVGKEGEPVVDLQSQPLADMGARGLTTDVMCPLEGLALNAEVIQCSCLKCRKASPSVRGQAAPRLAGQVCLNKKASLERTLEAAKKGEGERRSMKADAEVEQSFVDVRKCTVNIGHAGVSEERDGEGTSENDEVVLLDTAAKRPAAVVGRGSSRTAGESPPDVGVCSNSSDSVSSWVSDGERVSSEQGAPGVMEGSGTTGMPRVVDEGSGMGKYCSSEDVDMRAGERMNALSSTMEVHSKMEGSSLSGCPSYRNVVGQRLGVKRGGMRGHTGGSHGKSMTELENEVEGTEPVASTGKLDRKQRNNSKWKWLGSGGEDDGVEKEGSPGDSSFGQEADPQVTSETGRMRSKNVLEVPRSDASKRDLLGAWSGEMVPPPKRRKLLVPRRHQAVKATNVTEENLAAAARSLVDDSSRKKSGTMVVIRVPQGLNRQKAKKGIRTKLLQQPKYSAGDWESDSGKEGCAGWKDGRRAAEPRKSTASRAAGPPLKESMEGCVSGSDDAGFSPFPNIATKTIRSPRTPLGGPSPRNGRMVSLSAILNQPAAASLVQRTLEDSGTSSQQILRNGVAITISREGASTVFEFADEGDHVAAVPRTSFKRQETATAAVQTDGPLTGPGALPGRLETKSCPFPRGERSARPGVRKKRKVEWHQSGDAHAEVGRKISSTGAENFVSEKEGMFVCRVSQVRSSAGSSITREKLLEGFCEQGVPVRKQMRSSMAKRSDVAIGKGLQAKYWGGVPVETVAVAEIQKARQWQGQVKGGITGYGVLKRRPELSLPGVSVKRPRVALGLKQGKEGNVVEIEGFMDSGELLKSFRQKGLYSAQRKTEALGEDQWAGCGKMQKTEMPQAMERNGRSLAWRKGRRGGVVHGYQLGQGDKCRCDVCGTFSSASYNKLLCCGRCSVKVHQACYGVPKIPKGPWLCRICKFKVMNPICVLCGFGGGAMTRVQKARPLCQTLLQTWRELRNENACVSLLEDDDNDDDETLLSATTSIQLLRARSAGMTAKKTETNVRECESCDCAEPRDEASVCKVCGKESPEPGSSAGNGVKGSERGAVVCSGCEDWRRNNTVGSFVNDAGAKQWAHMVCTLWMPGTRCLNMGTMGVFDVSGVTASRRKALCSMCLRKGGACIQCRVPKCSTPFHVWCAHEKGLLQSETVKDGSNKVGFFGKCLSHAVSSGIESERVVEDVCPSSGGSCARTEGYKGRLSLEERATAKHNMTLLGVSAVTREQVAVWLRISDRKMNARRVLKSTNPVMKFDHREYLRFRQKKGWRKLAVCKSGIHAIGLYTTDLIAEGEVVVEYLGEIVGLRVADKREAEYHSGKRLQYQGACYLFRIDSEQIIDATRKGGIARFVNHSCSPNCVAKVICVDNLKKVIFFAKRDIYAGEEVTYDYKFNYDEVGDKIPCFCGTPECRGTLN